MPSRSAASPPSRLGVRSAALSAALLATILLASFTLLAGGPSGLASVLGRLEPRRLAEAAALMLAAEALRALRLAVITWFLGKPLNPAHALAARLLGRLAALLTPGGVASAPVRASVIGAYSGLHLGEALGVAVLESIMDSLVASLIAAASAIPLLPGSTVVIIMSIFASLLWAAGAFASASAGLAERLYARLGLPLSLRCRIEMQRVLFVKALRTAGNPGLFALIVALTVAAYVVDAYSVLVVWGGEPGVGALPVLPATLAAVAAAYVAGLFPTPGGSGVVELALSVYMGPRSLIEWRLAQITVSSLPAALILVVAPSLRGYFRAEASLGGDCGSLRG